MECQVKWTSMAAWEEPVASIRSTVHHLEPMTLRDFRNKCRATHTNKSSSRTELQIAILQALP